MRVKEWLISYINSTLSKLMRKHFDAGATNGQERRGIITNGRVQLQPLVCRHFKKSLLLHEDFTNAMEGRCIMHMSYFLAPSVVTRRSRLSPCTPAPRARVDCAKALIWASFIRSSSPSHFMKIVGVWCQSWRLFPSDILSYPPLIHVTIFIVISMSLPFQSGARDLR